MSLKGKWQPVEVEEGQPTEIEKPEEVNLPTLVGRWTSSAYVHVLPEISVTGRVNVLEPDFGENELTEEEQQSLKDKAAGATKVAPRLSPIVNDNCLLSKCWREMKVGSGCIWKDSCEGAVTSDTVFGIASLVWPGAYHLMSDDYEFDIYIGDGLRYDSEYCSPSPNSPFTQPQTDTPSAQQKSRPPTTTSDN